MQELVYSLNYILEHKDLMRNWVDIEVYREDKCMCNLCCEDCESVGHFSRVYSERRALFLEHLKIILGKNFKNCDVVWKSHFILGAELWGSRYEEFLRLVKSFIIDIWELHKPKLYGSGTGLLQH